MMNLKNVKSIEFDFGFSKKVAEVTVEMFDRPEVSHNVDYCVALDLLSDCRKNRNLRLLRSNVVGQKFGSIL